jgi:hypothetical protein
MNIHHVTIETLKKVEHVSTAKIMEISLTGALRNVLTGMKRRLSRDIISNQCRRSIWIKWRRILKVKKDYGVNPALFKSLYQDVKKILQRRANEAEEGN